MFENRDLFRHNFHEKQQKSVETHPHMAKSFYKKHGYNNGSMKIPNVELGDDSKPNSL